jgi:hypothetical protein
MQITYSAGVPTTVGEAFDFVSRPANWPSFFQHMESAEALEGWGRVGGKAKMVNRILGQDVITDIVLVEWDPPHSFRYIGHSRGRADTDNRRVFDAVPGGTRLTGTTTAQVGPGLAGLLDRLTLLAAHRVFNRAMKRLPAQVALQSDA